MGTSGKIVAIASHLPERVLSNDDLAALYPSWPADKILDKTGVQTRHIAAPDETAVDLAEAAAKALFAQGRVAPGDIDYLLFCTQAPDHILPTSACILHDAWGCGPISAPWISTSAVRASSTACPWPRP